MADFYSHNITSTPSNVLLHPSQTLIPLLSPYSHLPETIVTVAAFQKVAQFVYLYLKDGPSFKKAQRLGIPPKTHAIHMAISAVVIWRFFIQLLLNPFQAPVSTKFDLILDMAEVISSWAMIMLSPIKSTFHKSAFQTLVPMIGLSMALAYTTADPAWYQTAMRCVYWFVWFQWTYPIVSKAKVFEASKLSHDVLLHVIGHLISVPLTLGLADWPSANIAWLFIMPFTLKLNQWVTKEVPNNQAKRSLFMQGLIWLSFCEYATTRPPKAEEPVAN